jgi:hypothetical protein
MKKKRFLRIFAFFMALNIIFEVVSPTVALALTSGQIQPELTGFEPANSSEMVDLFTGDFKYNIPLMDVDGYPLNIAYHAGQNMESEASWVGLGWSLNPGALNRMVKGLPDDFLGEQIQSRTNIKPFAQMGVGYQFSAWLGANMDYANTGVGGQVGADGAVVLSYNNYKGYGLEIEMDAHASLTTRAGGVYMTNGGGIGMSLSSQDGGTLSYNHSHGVGVSFELPYGTAANIGVNYGEGKSINTRSGAATKSTFGSASAGAGGVNVSATISHVLPVGPVSFAPRISNDFLAGGLGLSVKAGLWGDIKFQLNGYTLPFSINGGLLMGFKGFYNLSKLKSKNNNLPSYGYLYAEKAPSNSLMDFNRFRDGSIFEQTPNISLSNQTYDIFSACAQGMGSNFRAFRSDNGTTHDNVGQNISANIHDAKELGGIFLVHINNDNSTNVTTGYSGVWNTLMNNTLSYKDKDIQQTANRFYEKYYFKQMGEISARDGGFDGAVGGEGPVSPVLIKKGDDYHATSPISGAARAKRDIRNTYIESLTAAQAKKYGYEPTINLYDVNTFSINASQRAVSKSGTSTNLNIDRTTKYVISGNVNVGHHLSEISLTNTSGSKYTYGIPVYNLYKKTVTFNASNRVETPYLGTGFPGTSYSQNPLLRSNPYQMVEYDPSGGKEIDNNFRGSDNHYLHNITPAFATSYLLTSITSPDYVDMKGDGPSYDDLGNYTKFNYYKSGEPGWREPFCYPKTQSNKPADWTNCEDGLTKSNQQANFDIGSIADELDDRGSYEYGIRENYYTHSIETKNFVAFFECSTREDAKGVSDEDGTVSSYQPLKLDNIKLYSKSEIIAKGSVAAAIPVKTVKFEYEYSLCPGTFNSTYNGGTNPDRGKLTLKKIRFTYGNSDKSSLSPYTFNYTTASNFPYNPRNVDRWGNYGPNSGSATGALGTLNNTEYPYSIQNKSQQDSYAEAWNLTEITTPTGSRIKVNYESDDYGYVQNEQAGQMLKIENVLTSAGSLPHTFNANADASAYPANINLKNSDYLMINLQDLRQGIPVATYSTLTLANSFVKSNLIKLNKRIYYKCFMKIAGPGNSWGLNKSYYDFVPGYATVLNAGVFTSGQTNNTYTDAGGNLCYKYAYVRIKKEIAYDTKDVNPIVYAGWDYTRNFLPRIAYPGSEPANMGDNSHKPLKQLQNALVGLGVAMADFVNGVSGSPNKRFYNKNFCNEMDYSKSFIRAYVPFKNKLGGGYRVKKITTEDRWDSMTASQEAKTTYGQIYDYTVTEGKLTISSGVALYEPIIGGDEISLRRPIDFEIEKMMAPNDHYYQEEPLGEMLYPAPLVGYSKVTITTLPDPGATSPPTNVCKIGKVEYEFYTAKDFPIITQRTGLSKRLMENDLIEDFIINTSSIKIFHAAQGHMLKFNDMHGKLRSIRNFGEDNPTVAISGVTYTYKASGAAYGSKQLITSVPTINESNQIATVNMSRDIDISADTRENINESITTGTTFLFEMGLIINFITLPTPPYLLVIPYPQIPNIDFGVVYGEQKFGSRTATITKIVQQYGILEKVESFDDKSKTTTENMLWDKNTGDVVLNKVSNNFDQPVYNFNYPAYWMYPQLGHEFKRDGLEILCKAYNNVTNPNPIWNFSSSPTGGGITQASITTPTLLLTTGDEVIIMDNTGAKIGGRFWVQRDLANWSATSYHYLMDEDGNIANTGSPYNLNAGTDYVIKIVKPVDENNIDESAGYVTSILDPSVSPTIPNIINYAGTGQKIIDAKALRFCSSPGFFMKSTSGQHLTNIGSNYSFSNFNLLTAGFQKKFRPTSSYVFNVDRTYNSQPNMKKDGFYSSFTPFWTYTSGQWQKNVTNWVVTNNNKLYSPYGYLLESEDAILTPNTQKYCFNHTLPALIAKNATYGEVGFESFEEYYSSSNIYSTLNSIDYTNVNNGDILGFYRQVTSLATSPPAFNTANAHTGRTSLLFSAGNGVKLTQDLLKSYQLMRAEYEYQSECLPSVRNLSTLNLINTKYLISMWVKGATQNLNYSGLVSLSVKVNYGTPVTISPTLINSGSPIINGWQKLDYEFTIPAGTSPNNVEITLGTTTGSSYYMDDFRLQPYNSTMSCNVYDPLSLRLWAQMDDQNYATIMEYDNEGVLIRKKKETYKGIYTTQESRKSNLKN